MLNFDLLSYRLSFLLISVSLATPLLLNAQVRYVPVATCGATGDGKTDDTFALTLCATRAAANGSTLFLPEGTYLVSSPIEIHSSMLMENSVTIKAVASMPA